MNPYQAKFFLRHSIIIALVAGNGGGTHSAFKEILLNHHIVGLDPKEAENYIELYPNPANGEVFLDFKETEPAIISITDLQGRSIAFDQQRYGRKVRIDLTSHANGVYLVKCEWPDMVIMKPLVISR